MPQFISQVNVVYGDAPADAPQSYIQEINGGNDNINDGFGGSYVWLVPVYTTDRSAAITHFSITIQKQADTSRTDALNKGAGEDYRYLDWTKDTSTTTKAIKQVTLFRSTDNTPMPPRGWDGATSNINQGRGGTYLYLVWKTY